MSGVSRLAQLVERKTLNLVVVGSSPTVGEHFFIFIKFFLFMLSKKVRDWSGIRTHASEETST